MYLVHSYRPSSVTNGIRIALGFKPGDSIKKTLDIVAVYIFCPGGKRTCKNNT
jgi:hypothetical protein